MCRFRRSASSTAVADRREDVQLVEAAYRLTLDRSNRQSTERSIDDFLGLLSPSVVFAPESDPAAPYRGRTAVRRLLARAAEQWDSVRYEVEEILDLGGGGVIASGKVLARPDRHRPPSEIPFVNRWTIRRGRAVRIDSITDREEAT
jgi:ketosteroid isomerase-like protein